MLQGQASTSTTCRSFITHASAQYFYLLLLDKSIQLLIENAFCKGSSYGALHDVYYSKSRVGIALYKCIIKMGARYCLLYDLGNDTGTDCGKTVSDRLLC